MNKDCVSLEVAQKLQKAGYKPKEDTHYQYECKMGKWGLIWEDYRKAPYYDTADHRQYIPAPTATQLAEDFEILLFGKCLTIERHTNDWRIGYYEYENGEKKISYITSASTLPDALGLMMCYLLENKLIQND